MEVILEKADNLEIDQTQRDRQAEQEEEELLVDCPECFDTMIKVYNSEDKLRYQCENCDLTIGNIGVQTVNE
jgi:ssDNA-binding Zn-finger/Zn-ribbon topoisomerase 1